MHGRSHEAPSTLELPPYYTGRQKYTYKQSFIPTVSRTSHKVYQTLSLAKWLLTAEGSRTKTTFPRKRGILNRYHETNAPHASLSFQFSIPANSVPTCQPAKRLTTFTCASLATHYRQG
jgi:hypothetical protein